MRHNKIQLCLLFASLFVLVFVSSPAAPAAGQSGGAGYHLFMPAVAKMDIPRWIGPDGGSVVSMAVDPNNGDTVYAGSWGGGVYKSTDGGAHWQYASLGIGNLLIHNLAIDPVDTDIIYAGTYQGGVYRSDDGGQLWQYASGGMQGMPIVYGLATGAGAFHNMVYAGTRDAYNCPCPPWKGTLYKSWDFGEHWSPVLYNVGGSDVQDWVYAIAVDPANPANVLAASHEHGIFRTDAYGGNLSEWHASNSGISDLSGRAVVFGFSGSKALYATWHGNGIYQTGNDGANWEQTSSGLTGVKIFPNALTIAKSNPKMVYTASMSDPGVGVRGVFRSSDGGSSWSTAGMKGFNIYTVRASTTNASVVYAGTQNSGLYKSVDGGASWLPSMKGIANTSVNGAVSPLPNLIMISSYGSGIFYSADGGQNWGTLNAGLVDLNVNGLYYNPEQPYILYALTERAGLKRYDLSTGGPWLASAAGRAASNADRGALTGQAWETVQPFAASGEPVQLPARDDPFTVIDPAREILAGDANQAAARPAAVGSAPLPTTAPLLSMAFAPGSKKIMYVGTNGSGIFASSDAGQSWFQATVGLQGLMVRGLAVSQSSPAVVYAATNLSGQIKVTENGGASWTSMVLPRADLLVYAAATTKEGTDPTNVLYLGTSDGLWRLKGGIWSQAALGGSIVTSVAVRVTDPGAVFVGTTNGAYISRTPGQWLMVSPLTFGHVIQAIGFDYGNNQDVFFGANTHGLFVMPQ